MELSSQQYLVQQYFGDDDPGFYNPFSSRGCSLLNAGEPSTILPLSSVASNPNQRQKGQKSDNECVQQQYTKRLSKMPLYAQTSGVLIRHQNDNDNVFAFIFQDYEEVELPC